MRNRIPALVLLTVCLCIIHVQCQRLSLRCMAENSEAGKGSDTTKPCEVRAHTVRLFNGSQQFRDNDTCLNLQANLPSTVGFILSYHYPRLPYYRDGSRVPVCSSISGVSVAERPTWVDSANQALVNENIQTHCFVLHERHAVEPGKFPYKMLYRIINENGNWAWNELAVLIPDNEKYLVLNDYADIDKYCARCVFLFGGGCGRGYQPLLANPPKNLNETLEKLIKSYSYYS